MYTLIASKALASNMSWRECSAMTVSRSDGTERACVKDTHELGARSRLLRGDQRQQFGFEELSRTYAHCQQRQRRGAGHSTHLSCDLEAAESVAGGVRHRVLDGKSLAGCKRSYIGAVRGGERAGRTCLSIMELSVSLEARVSVHFSVHMSRVLLLNVYKMGQCIDDFRRGAVSESGVGLWSRLSFS